MIELMENELHFQFPEVHEGAHCSVEFQRTLRIPDDDRTHFLPPGLGGFPLRHLDDHATRLPEAWRRRGGVIMPMHQAEALWINFTARYPFALKIATGKVCAVTGEAWVNRLNRDPQDYVVVPEQPWLDGYCVEKGVIRQFVAMPLGEGYSVEEQLTGSALHGGLQIVAYPMKRERYEELRARLAQSFYGLRGPAMMVAEAAPQAMGLAPGGRMKQEVYDDPHGLEAWDQRHGSRCFVTIANSKQWMAVTGECPPTEPPTAKQYTEMGLPWFDYYGGDAEAVAGAATLNGLVGVARMGEKKGEAPLPENELTVAPHVIGLLAKGSSRVREFPE